MSMIFDSIEFVSDGRHKIELRIQRSCLFRKLYTNITDIKDHLHHYSFFVELRYLLRNVASIKLHRSKITIPYNAFINNSYIIFSGQFILLCFCLMLSEN